ncbi:MAG TPA: porin [Noviherbaspirillum sp.]|uniref:porin n=1 Tax=Noviherbaspirillum sp. TaxID=1926288 RepID=UPI002D45119A|nr:porin [Noviherbaspirillum sp.]HYD94784.1 porin [Noviherbaspirillum sp.]
MKKSLIAFAVLAAFAGAASAQTNVTIYGVADAGISRVDNGATTTTRMDSGIQSGSRVGFRGTEDLGGGLSAIFTLENGFNIDDGTLGQGGRLFGRQAFVGLSSGSAGAIKFGRQYNPIRTAVENIDPFALGLAGNASNVFNVYGDRADNTINYSTPKLGGFSGQLAYSLGEAAGSTSVGRHLGLSAGYAAGPLNIILAHHDQNIVAAGAANGDSKTTLLGGTYDFGILKLHAAYARNKGANAAGVTTIDRDDALLGLTVPVGATSRVLASWIRRSDDIGANRDADQIALGYTYDLSKRTNLYTSYARTRNEAAAALNGASAAGRDPSIFNVGVRHRF